MPKPIPNSHKSAHRCIREVELESLQEVLNAAHDLISTLENTPQNRKILKKLEKGRELVTAVSTWETRWLPEEQENMMVDEPPLRV